MLKDRRMIICTLVSFLVVLVSYAFQSGLLRDPSRKIIGNDARPAVVKTSLAYTLHRLGTDYVDIYRPAHSQANKDACELQIYLIIIVVAINSSLSMVADC